MHTANSFSLRRYFSKLFSDIRPWILLYFIIRLYFITQPPLETAHNWRQCTGLMVSRNFYERDANILYPQLDNGGDKTGITGTEFPLYNYLIYLVAKVFGWADWYGRIVNLIVSSLGVYFFYRLVKEYISPQIAFFATLILLNSLWFSYSRKTMPDTFSTALVMAGLYYGLGFLYKGGFWRWLAYVLLALAGMLSKIPAGYLMVLFIPPLISRRILLQRKLAVIGGGIIVLIPVVWWYFIWVPYLVRTFGFWHYFMGVGMMEGARDIAAHISLALDKFYFSALNYIGFGLFCAGLIYAFVRKQKRLLAIFGLCFAGFFVIILKSGFAFYHHAYYILPFVPPMALMAGYAISQVPNARFRGVLVFAVATEVILNALPDYRVNSDVWYKATLEKQIGQLTAFNDRIAINCGENPQMMYMAHRKGWCIENSQAQDTTFMSSIAHLGCKVLVVDRHEGDLNNLPYRRISENQDFIFYQL
jgi:hypothetical protein